MICCCNKVCLRSQWSCFRATFSICVILALYTQPM
jgi:hypothetical protein